MTRPVARFSLVIPAHNRSALTVDCLRHLRDVGVLAWAQAIVVDDGSTDGTGAAVAAKFPEAVVLRGDGHLWWTGAIAWGMRHALASPSATAVFWLNDDCRPDAGALELLRDVALAGECVAVGQVFGPTGLQHGGLRKRWHGLELVACPLGQVASVATMNGNCVCVPARIAARAGLPDAARFPQAGGDTDYGFRCQQLGIPIRVMGSVRCTDADRADPRASSWLRGDRPLGEIARSFGSPKNYYYPSAWWLFNWRHWGVLGILLFAAPYLRFAAIAFVRAVAPRRLLRRA